MYSGKYLGAAESIRNVSAKNQTPTSAWPAIAAWCLISPPIEAIWAAAGFIDTLLRCDMKSEIVYGYDKEIQSEVQGYQSKIERVFHCLTATFSRNLKNDLRFVFFLLPANSASAKLIDPSRALLGSHQRASRIFGGLAQSLPRGLGRVCMVFGSKPSNISEISRICLEAINSP